MALDGGLIKEANNCSQWFFSLHSVASGLEKPLLAGYRTAHCSSATIVIALFLASFLPQHQHLSVVAVLPGLIPNDAQTTDRHLCHHLHWPSRSAVFTCLPEFVVHGCTGLLFESFIYNLNWSLLSEQHWEQFGWTFENTDHFPVD